MSSSSCMVNRLLSLRESAKRGEDVSGKALELCSDAIEELVKSELLLDKISSEAHKVTSEMNYFWGKYFGDFGS